MASQVYMLSLKVWPRRSARLGVWPPWRPRSSCSSCWYALILSQLGTSLFGTSAEVCVGLRAPRDSFAVRCAPYAAGFLRMVSVHVSG